MSDRLVTLAEFHVSQVVQLEELLAVRHSVFVVGSAGTGKSQVLRSLHKTYQIDLLERPVILTLPFIWGIPSLPVDPFILWTSLQGIMSRGFLGVSRSPLLPGFGSLWGHFLPS